jgi:putative endonuclease
MALWAPKLSSGGIYTIVVIMDKNYIVYCLVSCVNPKRTYLGSTYDMIRRLRSHNGLRSGGARYTRAWRPWKVWFTIEGFANRKEALQFEYNMKHKRSVKGPLATYHKLRQDNLKICLMMCKNLYYPLQ